MVEKNDTFWQEIKVGISAAKKYNFEPVRCLLLSSGITGETFRLQTKSESIFLKLIDINRSPILYSEAEGLKAISNTNTLKTPRIFAKGESADFSWLALEFISLRSPNTSCAIEMGEGLAAMHQYQNDFHGWHSDNWIGANKQRNSFSNDWPNFFKEFRLLPQLNQALDNNLDTSVFDSGELLVEEISKLFTNYYPTPSLLHGDLWTGNWASDPEGNPIVFDPACYYGDRETDIAMTELFAGFREDFYDAYNSVNPIDKGYVERKSVYNLYHILNHFNIFGVSYQQQASDLIQKSLSAIR